MNTIPGVFMKRRSSQSYRLNIRGSTLVSPFGVRNEKIYYNGIPLTDSGGGTYLNELSTEDMYSLTVIKGPGAGTGGVVLVECPLFSNDSLRNSVKISLEGGSYGLQRLAATLTWGDSRQKSQLRCRGMRDNGKYYNAAHGVNFYISFILKYLM